MGSEGDLRSDSNPSSSSHDPNPNVESVTAATAAAAGPAARRASYPVSSRDVSATTFAGSAAEPSPKRAKLSCPYHDNGSAASARGSDSCSFCASAAANPGKSSEDHPAGAAAICHATIGRFATLSMGMGAGDGAADSAGEGQVGRSCQPSDRDRLGSKGQIRTVEFIRLIEQSLRSLGYDSIAAQLEAESGVAVESKPVGVNSASAEVLEQHSDEVLEQHSDEVWCVQFSHDGTRLATASKDHTAVVWQIHDSFSHRRLHTLAGHSLPLSYVAWSPDDSLLLTAGNDPFVCLWDAATGRLLRSFSKHHDAISACAWFSCGRRFLSASAATDRTVCVWDVEGSELPSWGGVGRHLWQQDGGDFPRINDLAISSDCSHVVSVCNEKEIRVHELPSGKEHVVKETKSITSLSMSVDGRWVLVNLSSGDIHLWCIQDICAAKPPDKPAFSYSGQVQGRFVIRSCFGGHDQRFIISGSEDAQVYMWHRDTGEVMEVLPGHSGTVNAVSWPATRPHMFATASDDGTVRIWGLPSLVAGGLGMEMGGSDGGTGMNVETDREDGGGSAMVGTE
ncbi:unnamed protein product [Closterium sp. Naga37s-1]|nr:unnamed protein product [Closterium sp. Naga37s-1]